MYCGMSRTERTMKAQAFSATVLYGADEGLVGSEVASWCAYHATTRGLHEFQVSAYVDLRFVARGCVEVCVCVCARARAPA